MCGSLAWRTGDGVGSVSRRRMSTKVPVIPTTIAKINGAGSATEIASHAVMSGPTVKMTSSEILSRAKAVRSFGEDVDSAREITNVQRALTAGPIAGEQRPAAAASIVDTKNGSFNSMLRMKNTSPRLSPVTSQPKTLCCPWRSTNRLEAIMPTAAAREKAADITPASPYEPVTPLVNNKIPRPTRAIGSRATRPLAEKASAPGTRNTSR